MGVAYNTTLYTDSVLSQLDSIPWQLIIIIIGIVVAVLYFLSKFIKKIE